MPEYPSWVEFLSYLGLDPITVWTEYRFALYAALWLLFVLLVCLIYFLGIQLRFFLATFRYTFNDRTTLFKYIEEMPEKEQEPCFNALDGVPMIFGIPALSIQDVTGFEKAVGYLLVTSKNLIFASGGQKILFKVDGIQDANLRGGIKYMELKLQVGGKKPIFYLLGISEEQGQEVFMKIHALRQALKEKQPKT